MAVAPLVASYLHDVQQGAVRVGSLDCLLAQLALPSLGRLVALEMLPADLSGDDLALARFRREMRALGRCDHPNIVKVLDSGTSDDGQLYYAMEYVPGADLEDVWQELAAG